LQDDFAYKGYRTGLYYYRIKAYDSSILYLRDVVATYPRATIAPGGPGAAGQGVPGAGL
jgi:outer membrane protein assembly factor BamD (BamD/ComL family)